MPHRRALVQEQEGKEWQEMAGRPAFKAQLHAFECDVGQLQGLSRASVTELMNITYLQCQ